MQIFYLLFGITFQVILSKFIDAKLYEDPHSALQIIDERDIFQGNDVVTGKPLYEETTKAINIKSVDVIDINDVVFTNPHDHDKDEDEIIPLDAPMLQNFSLPENVSTANVTEEAATNNSVTFECQLRTLPENEIAAVSQANGTLLQSILVPSNATNVTLAHCAVVLFFSSQCIFSARVAPHYNALARVFPGIEFYALDTSIHSGSHARYGIVAVPNILLFHNAKAVARFNETHVNLENLVSFVSKYTTLEYNGTLNVTSADMSGPVPATLNKKVDYMLIVSWIFTLFCLCFRFLKSSLCHKIVECVRNTWIEAEAQHEHRD